jgi:methylmalonyl-CoA/ethylmalonyl-CoA epimerase
MSVKGINRIIVAVRDIEAARRYYHDLLGAEFRDANWTGAPFGIAVAIAWNVGIELCAPLPGREHDSAVSGFLAQHGEGVMNVYFDTDDAESALARATACGVACQHALDYSQAEIDAHLGGLFRRYQEFVLGTAAQCGFGVSLARIEPRASTG